MESLFPNFQREQTTDALAYPQITEKFDWSHFATLGNYIAHNQPIILESSTSMKQFFDDSRKDIFLATLALLTIPPTLQPQNVITLYQFVTQKSPKIPEKYFFPITMNYVSALIESGQGSAIKAELKQKAEVQPTVFAAPYQFLCASIGEPDPTEFRLPSTIRHAAIQLFYQALNTLETGQIEEAEKQFLHAWSFTHECKDLRFSVLLYLGLTQFLLGKSYNVYKSIIPDDMVAPTEVEAMFNIDDKNYKVLTTFHPWENYILIERAKRIIIDIARTYSHISRARLAEICSFTDFERALGVAFNYISGEERDGILFFDPPSHTTIIEKEIESVQNDLNEYLKAQ